MKEGGGGLQGRPAALRRGQRDGGVRATLGHGSGAAEHPGPHRCGPGPASGEVRRPGDDQERRFADSCAEAAAWLAELERLSDEVQRLPSASDSQGLGKKHERLGSWKWV